MQQIITGGDGSSGQTGEEIKDIINENFDELYNATAVALVDGATIDLTAIKHTLSTSLAAITFTISYTGDDITLEVTLSATASTFTFPAGSLCFSQGSASGDNTLTLSGVSGDVYIIAVKKIGSNYRVICSNLGQ